MTAVRTRPARPAVPSSTCRPRISSEDRGSRQPISSLACTAYRQCAWSDSRGYYADARKGLSLARIEAGSVSTRCSVGCLSREWPHDRVATSFRPRRADTRGDPCLHRGAPAAGQRAFAQLSGPAGWSAAGGPASRREAARPQQREARVFRCPVFRCPWPLPHAHRNIGRIARTRAPCEGPRLAIGPTQVAAGKQMGKRSEHCPGTPVYRPPGARSGAAARGQRNRAGLVAPGGTKTVFAAAPRPRSGQHWRNIGARRARRRNSRGTAVSGRRTCISPGRATTRRQPHPGSHAATRIQPPRIGNIGVQTANILRYRRDQVP